MRLPSLDPTLRADLSGPVEAATIAIARLDERLARAGDGGLADGAIARAHVFEAQAIVGLMGGVAPLEDIVLNEADMDARLPTTEVVNAVTLLRLRQALARRKPEAILSEAGLSDLLGVVPPTDGQGDNVATAAATVRAAPALWDLPLPRSDNADARDEPDEDDEPLSDDDRSAVSWPPRSGASALDDALAEADALLARSRRSLDRFNDLSSEAGRAAVRVSDPTYDEPGRIEAWRAALEDAADLPSTLAAAVALDAWLMLEPSEHRGEAGFLIAATLLRFRGLAARHMPALALGYRKARVRWSPHQARRTRLSGLLSAIAESARAGQADLDRLSLARDVMLGRCEGRSRNSRLKDLVDLFVSSPLVTVPLAAKRLDVTPQAIEAMLKQLGHSLPRELTGRKRYRAWGIV
jgi:hypothetical protein